MDNAADVIARYRSVHRIAPNLDEFERGRFRCLVDGIEVLRVKGGFRHHPDTILRLMDATYGQPWPSKDDRIVDTAVEVGRDYIREELPLSALETPRLRVLDADEYDETIEDGWTNREGMPEFNGAFR